MINDLILALEEDTEQAVELRNRLIDALFPQGIRVEVMEVSEWDSDRAVVQVSVQLGNLSDYDSATL